MKREVKRKLKIQRPPILTAKTQKLVAAVQKELDLPLLVYWVSTGGSICQNDVIAMSRLLGQIKKEAKIRLQNLARNECSSSVSITKCLFCPSSFENYDRRRANR